MTGTRYQVHIQDSDGTVIEGAELEVRDQDSNSLVTIWDNRATTTTKTNPTTSNANGYAYFYRTGGRYKITVTSGAFSQTFQDVPLGNSQEYDVGTSAGTLVLYENFASVAFDGLYSSLTGAPTLGTMAALDSGTDSDEFRTNAQNDTRFLKVDNNLNDVTASSARANLDLSNIYSLEGVVTNTHIPLKRAGAFVDSPLSFDGNDAAAFGGNGPTSFDHDVDIDGSLTVDTIDTGQGAVECYAMDQAVRTTDAVTFAQVNTDNIRVDGNTISSTDTNGNVTIDPNGTGTVELSADTNVTGAMTATTGVTVASSQDAITDWIDSQEDTGQSVSGSGGSAGTYAASAYGMTYTRHGNMVRVDGILFQVADKGSWSGDVRLGVPFTCASGTYAYHGQAVTEHHTIGTNMVAVIVSGQDYVRVRFSNTGTTSNFMQWSDISTTAGNAIRFSIEFPVD